MNSPSTPHRKVGYHRLIMPDGSEHRMVVAELDNDGRVVGFHPLRGEEPFVEWQGGTRQM